MGVSLALQIVADGLRCMAGKEIIRQDVHVLLLLFRAVVTNKGESGVCTRFNTNCFKLKASHSCLPLSSFQSEYYVLNGLSLNKEAWEFCKIKSKWKF